MQHNMCLVRNHGESRINAICFDTKCKGKRLSCHQCLAEFHKDHIDQLVDIDQILPYIKDMSQEPIIQSDQVIQTLEELVQVQTLIDGLQKLNGQQIERIRQSSQNNLEDILSKYNIQDIETHNLRNQQWNQLVDDMVKHFQVQNSQIIQKAQVMSLDQNFVNQFNLILTQIESTFSLINDHYRTNQFRDFNEKQLLTGHTNTILGLDICKEKNILATGSHDTVILWNLDNNTLINKYTCSAPIYAVAFSNEGNLLSFGGRGNSVNLIDISDLKKQHQITEPYSHQNCVNRLKFTNDSKYLISGSDDKKIIVWNIIEKKEFYRLNVESFVFGLAINENDSILGSNFNDGQIWLWNFQNQKLLYSLKAHEKGGGISFSNDQKMLVSSGSDGIIKLWSLEKLNQGNLVLIREFKAADRWIWNVLFTSCCQFIISICNQDRKIEIIDLKTGQVVKLFKSESTNNGNAIGLATSKNMDIIAFGEDNNVVVWRRK